GPTPFEPYQALILWGPRPGAGAETQPPKTAGRKIFAGAPKQRERSFRRIASLIVCSEVIVGNLVLNHPEDRADSPAGNRRAEHFYPGYRQLPGEAPGRECGNGTNGMPPDQLLIEAYPLHRVRRRLSAALHFHSPQCVADIPSMMRRNEAPGIQGK